MQHLLLHCPCPHALRSDLLLAVVGYPVALRAVEAVVPDVFDDFVTARRVCVPFLLDPVAAFPEPLWLGRRAAVFLCAVVDAAFDRSQSSFPLHVLPSFWPCVAFWTPSSLLPGLPCGLRRDLGCPHWARGLG